MNSISEAAAALGKKGYKAMKEKYSEEERLAWRKKGAEANRLAWKKKRKNNPK